MKLIWKLLRKHISIAQLCGFFLANFIGMTIVLLSIQFYKDVIPMFEAGDSFLKKEYIVVTKKVNALNSIIRKNNTFSKKEIIELSNQPFVQNLGTFTPSQFKVTAGMGMTGTSLGMTTEMFFESVPDEFVDANLDKWIFNEENNLIPIIIPRNYLNLYNFGFAQSRNLPQLSEGLMSLIQMDINLRGNGDYRNFKGNIVGFSNRLNTILVPQSFMDWANKEFSSEGNINPSRLIVEINNPTDATVAQYFQQKGYETEDGKLDNGKASYFLRVIIIIVLCIGLIISILSFYILILSIYLLVQKNTTKFENLLLIGYAPTKIALPYQIMSTSLNLVLTVLSILTVIVLRKAYMTKLNELFPQIENNSLLTTYIIGLILFILISIFNVIIIRNKINSIRNSK